MVPKNKSSKALHERPGRQNWRSCLKNQKLEKKRVITVTPITLQQQGPFENSK